MNCLVEFGRRIGVCSSLRGRPEEDLGLPVKIGGPRMEENFKARGERQDLTLLLLSLDDRWHQKTKVTLRQL